EPGDAGGVAHDAPRLGVEINADKDVSGQYHAVGRLLMAVLDLGVLLDGDLDLEDLLLGTEGDGARLQVGLHLVLVPRVRVDPEPVARQLAELTLERD